MNAPPETSSPSVGRRAVLTGVAGGLAATSGCVNRLRTVMGRQRPDPVTVTIKTVPADDDPYALLIARSLAGWFESAGIDVNVVPMASEELLRQVLVNYDFDLFVGRLPGRDVDPDSLYALLHSRFGVEPGWQNPFGYADLTVDDLVERQREALGSRRRSAVGELQRTVARENPFTVLAFPDVIRTVRTDRFAGFAGAGSDPLWGLLGMERVDSSAETLRATTTDERVTNSLNPLVASMHGPAAVTDLVFDSLGRRSGAGVVPWVADSWEFTGDGALDVTLRPDLSFHDGEALSAADVAFSYEFLRDTSLGEREESAPTMNYRGRSTLVESATALDGRTVRLTVGDRTRSVVRRALTVPILPRHVWKDRTGQATVGGLDVGGSTEALVTDNLPPVGSGPLAFRNARTNERLVLERFEDHFSRRESSGLPDDAGVSFRRLVLQHVGSDAAAVELVASGDADLTLAGLGPDVVRRIGRADDLDLVVERDRSPYFLGCNTRRSPFGNPRFRQLLTRLVDRRDLVRSVFSSFARPSVTPLAGTDWVPESLTWSGEDPVSPFLGSNGRVDAERARTAFREAGYQYDERGNLLGS